MQLMTMPCERVRRARPLLGTIVEISLTGSDASALHESANAAFDMIARIHELMSFHLAASDVSRLNNSEPGQNVRIDPHSWQVIRLANEISRASDGVFDIAVGGAMTARGDLPNMLCRTSDEGASYSDIELLAGSHVRLRRSLVIDVGGIAKGYAVDCAVSVLRERGVASGCVNAGGDLRVFGDETVQVDVRDPLHPGNTAARVELLNCAFASSANYASHEGFTAAGVVLDPRDVCGMVSGRSASVRASSCVIADALAKCVFILGQASAALLRQYDADGFVLGHEEPVVIDKHAADTQSHERKLRNATPGRANSLASKSQDVASVDANSFGMVL